MIANQMEFGLETQTSPRRARRPQRRLPGARWWFEQMHRAVDQAAETDRLRKVRQRDFTFPGGRN